jgi:hypothetical protein
MTRSASFEPSERSELSPRHRALLSAESELAVELGVPRRIGEDAHPRYENVLQLTTSVPDYAMCRLRKRGR